MSDVAYNYFNKLDTLDLSDLELLLDRIRSLIFAKKKASDVENGIAFFNSIRGSVDGEINAKEELASALDEKYAYSN